MTGPTERENCTECGGSVKAYCKFVFPETGFDLWYCAHHTARYGEGLAAKGAILVVDNREELERA